MILCAYKGDKDEFFRLKKFNLTVWMVLPNFFREMFALKSH